MCGIVGYIGNENATEILLDGLRRLEYRGYDSAGIAVLNDKGAQLRRAEGKLINLEREVFRRPPTGTIGIGHTRWATHGRPSKQNAHPHRVGSVMVIHNGIIENYASLRKRLSDDESRHFESDTDTEVVAHLIDHYCKAGSKMKEAFRQTLKDLEGSYALVVLYEDDPDCLYLARCGSPLVIGVGKGCHYLASDIPALLPYTRDVLFLEDGDYGMMRRESLQLFDCHDQAVTRKSRYISWNQAMAEKGGYRHFMLKEIYEQPWAVSQTLAGRLGPNHQGVLLPGMDALMGGRDFSFDKVYVVACGTSYHAGMVGKYLIESFARIHVAVDQASEFRYRNPIVDDKTLIVAISQSGETADTLAAVQQARQQGAKVLSICNVIDASIPRASDHTIYTQAGPEIGVASTKAFVTQLVVLILVALEWAGRCKHLKPEAMAAAVQELTLLPDKLRHTLELDPKIDRLSRRYTGTVSFLYFARGIHYPIALEGALKLKEISYIHAEGYSAGEMKHGPIALIDSGFPVLVLAPQGDVLYDKVLSNIEEVRARSAEVITVATQGDNVVAELSKEILFIPIAPWYLQPILEVIPLQLLAYHIADHKGTDVDQPRNLAKSVTVE